MTRTMRMLAIALRDAWRASQGKLRFSVTPRAYVTKAPRFVPASLRRCRNQMTPVGDLRIDLKWVEIFAAVVIAQLAPQHDGSVSHASARLMFHTS